MGGKLVDEKGNVDCFGWNMRGFVGEKINRKIERVIGFFYQN